MAKKIFIEMIRTFLIVGASGYIGSYFLKNILETTELNIIATKTKNSSASILHERIKWLDLDISDFAEVDSFCDQLSKLNTRLDVIYLAAYHHPDKVEKDPQFAWGINIVALSNIINKIPSIRTFYYSSTDSVYGESFDGYRFKETDDHVPLNEYGKQKSLAEKIVLSRGYGVIHYPFLIGPSLANKKHFYDMIVDDFVSGKKVEAFFDSCRSSLDFNSASLYALQLIERGDNFGTVNICSDISYSKYDIILQIANRHGFSAENIHSILAKESNWVSIAKRPLVTLLDNSKLKKILALEKIEPKI